MSQTSRNCNLSTDPELSSTIPVAVDPDCTFTGEITAEFADSLIGMTEEALEAAFARWLAAQGIGR